MSFPVESEATIRRRVLDICQQHARNVVDVTRELTLVVDAMCEGKAKSAKQHYINIGKLLEEAAKIKSTMISEVASAGSLLLGREDFLRLMSRMGETAEYAEALGYMVVTAAENKFKLEKRYLQKISVIVGLVLKEISKVRETLHSLSFDPEKAVESSRSVEDLERRIDIDVRNLDLDLLSSKLPLPMMMFFRDMVERAERIADIGLDVVDHIRLLAVTA